MSPPYSVVLADDHALVRRGLAALLTLDGRYRVVAEAGNGEDAIAAVRAHDPDVVILDLAMPRLDGLEAVRRLRKLASRAKILVLTMFEDEQFAAKALGDGANGYLLKHAMDEDLFCALDAVLGGHRFVSPGIDRARLEAAEAFHCDLTARELEVLQLIAAGHTTQELAEILNISPHTATRHRANLMQKLDAHNQVELVRVAVARGLILMPRS